MANRNNNPCISILQTAAITGLSVHMITYLGRMDILKPTHGGRGKPRLYAFNDVLFLKVIAEMLARGIEVKRLKESLQRARAESQLWIDIRQEPRRYLVTDGTELFIRSKGKLESKTRDRQLAFAFVLDLAPAHRSVSASWPHHKSVDSASRDRRHRR